MSAIDVVMGHLDGMNIIKAETRLRGEILSMASQTEANKMIRQMLARYLAEKLEPLHREFVDRRDDRGNAYKMGEPAPYEAFGPGHDMLVHGELFVLTRAQYDGLVEAVAQIAHDLEHRGAPL